jgi:hypothetical protein
MSDAQADPTVAATLSAAYPEVDASIVSLILVEARGDAAEAARQLAVLAGEGGDDNRRECRHTVVSPPFFLPLLLSLTDSVRVLAKAVPAQPHGSHESRRKRRRNSEQH